MPSFIKKNEALKHVASIDLGSNAMRGVIARVHHNEIQEIKQFRYPLRLGEEVFKTGKISTTKMKYAEEAFIELFHHLVEYNVTEVSAKATSAMREAKNSKSLIKSIAKFTGIQIETISGDEEANLILKAVDNQIRLKKKTAVLMDIGGGSTEIIVIKNGEILGVQSFNVGTVRLLEYKNQQQLEKHIEEEIKNILNFIEKFLGKKKPNFFIGTGGNLRRIGKIRKSVLGKSSSEYALYSEIEHMENSILEMSNIDRIRQLELDKNRADVILPAIMLTQHLMASLKLKKIMLPKVGLREGILLSMVDFKPKNFSLLD